MSAYEAFASVYDIFMEQVEYDQWLRHIHAVWEKYGVKPESIIDLGCGTGSIALPLAKEGFDVIGVDLSPEMLTEADHKAMEEGVSVRFACQDMTELELPQYRQREGITAWRITGTLREFAAFPPVDVWFDYPLHVIEHFDTKEVAPHHELQPHQRAMNARKSKEQKLKERKRRLEAAYDICSADGPVTVSTLAEYLGVSLDTIRRSVDEHPSFNRENGVVSRVFHK